MSLLAALGEFFGARMTQDGQDDEQALALACAALLLEVSRADAEVDTRERDALRSRLAERFALAEADLDELEALAEREVEEATDLFQFTRLITEHYDAQARVALVEQLWSVAWADGRIDAHEEHLIRRIADLIHVRHSDFVAARQRTRPA